MSEQVINSVSNLQGIQVQKVAQNFKSKADFVNYFKTQLQFYVPPIDQMTKDWLKSILNGERKLLKLSELKAVHVGNFQEVSVKNLYAEFSKREDCNKYLPAKLAKGKQLDREYFFNIVNTLYPEELQSIIEHAHSQRNTIQDEDKKQEAIMMSEEMASQMFKFPFISKSKGRTVHLLKAKSKSQRIMKPRKTFGVLPKEKRSFKPLPQPQRVRPHQEADEEMSNETTQQRKRIQPTIVVEYPTKK